jgi:tetratricopeptide (TPR) repeat protein
MKKNLSFLLIFVLLISSINVSAGILSRTKLKLEERNSSLYSVLDEEFESLEDVPFMYSKVKGMSELAVNYLFSGTFETTYNMLEQATEDCGQIEDYYYQSMAYLQISQAYAEFMNIIGVRELSKKAALKGIEVAETKVYNTYKKVRLYNEFIKILMKTRYYKEANTLLVKVLNDFDNIENDYFKSASALELSVIVSVLKGDDELAAQLFETSYNKADSLNDFYLQSIIMAEIADYAKIKKMDNFFNNCIDKANNSALQIEDNYYKQKAFNNLARTLLINGNKDKATDIIENICIPASFQLTDSYFQAMCFNQIAGFYYVTGEQEKADNMLEKTQIALNGINSPYLKTDSAERMFWIYYILDMKTKAYEINEKSYEWAMKIDNSNKLNALLNVAINYSHLRMFEKVNEIVELIK